MSVHTSIVIHKECKDIDKGNDWITEIKDLLQGKVEGTFQSQNQNHSPTEKLTKEQESE